MIRTRYTSYHAQAPIYNRRPWYKKRKSWVIVVGIVASFTLFVRQTLFQIEQKESLAKEKEEEVKLTSIEKTVQSFFGNKKAGSSEGEEDEDKHHFDGRYPHSLLTLFYPYTMLRDVVLDQPVADTDIPFFWHLHKSDEGLIKGILKDCYNLQIVELNDLKSIEHAKEVDLVAGLDRTKHVITSPFIRETATVFSKDNFGRMFCFTRHPVDYDVHPALPNFAPHNDNWLCRLLSDVHVEPITFKQLGVAKKVLFQTCVMGTLDKMKESIIRQADYFGWSKLGKGEGPKKTSAGQKKKLTDEDIQNEKDALEDYEREEEQCLDRHLDGNIPEETFVDHDSDEWKEFYKTNLYDCQLYEIGRSVWRAQIQTIIPHYLQVQRDNPDDDEEE